jgi:hypothetical protein
MTDDALVRFVEAGALLQLDNVLLKNRVGRLRQDGRRPNQSPG